jgi:hypothetical protein
MVRVSSPRPPTLRKAAASRLRSLADRVEPRLVARVRPSAAPLVRIGGRWWSRAALVGDDEPPPR